ncbi:MAG: hypothetical protein QOF58_5425 [Pseudonocardiales bacterium]|jgi:hypothetical protein|nr:hypothetical protein [Pseudonocardiales bacterium]
MTACSCCGAEVDETGMITVDMGLPVEPSEEPADDIVLADGFGYVRAVLRLRLTGDLELWLGAWMRVSAEDARRAHEPGVRLTGTFAHDIKPWQGLLDAEVVCEALEPDQLPFYVQHPLLGTEWERDEVLSAFFAELPVSVQQKLLGKWSIERTAGLTPLLDPAGLRFVGPGRTVILDIRRAPGVAADLFLDMALAGAPSVPPDQTLRTSNGIEARHALWLTTSPEGVPQHEFFGHVARPGDMLIVTCIHDDPADHAWARHVLNSVRYGA